MISLPRTPWGIVALTLRMALGGWLFAGRNMKVKIFYLPYYFLFMNLSVFIGFFRFISNTQSAIWEKSARQSAP